MTFWRITYSNKSICYVSSDDESFNAADGLLHPVSDLIGAAPKALATLGAEVCTVVGRPFDERLFIPSMTFSGLKVTHTGSQHHIDVVRSRVGNALAHRAEIEDRAGNTATADALRAKMEATRTISRAALVALATDADSAAIGG